MASEGMFCPHCGANQTKDDVRERLDQMEESLTNTIRKENTAALTRLCTLALFLAAFGLLRAYFVELIGSKLDSSDYGWRLFGWIFMLGHLGKAIGAMMMLKRSLRALYIYTASMVIYLLAVFIKTGAYHNQWSLWSSMVIALPGLVLLYLFWRPDIRNKLA